jgi:hypothetical protein
MIKRIHIYDLDGTVIDSSHRYRTVHDKNGNLRIDLKYWRDHDNENFIKYDTLLPLAEQYKRDLADDEIYVIIATARACVTGDANYKFIKDHLGLPNHFIHRLGINDKRKGSEIKINGIKPLLNLKQFRNAVKVFFEDNIDYLINVAYAIDAHPVFVKSNQGF